MKAGGYIPDPGYDLRRRVDGLEARIAELEKGKAEPRNCHNCKYAHIYAMDAPCSQCNINEDDLWEPKTEPEPEQWKPYPIYFNFESIVQHPQAQWMEEKVTRYANQLQWLYKHYPEQNGEWSEVNRWSVCQLESGAWTNRDNMRLKDPALIYMSQEAAIRLAVDLNSGKVKF